MVSAPVFSVAASRFASSGIVRLQLQSLSVLFWIDIVCSRLWRFRRRIRRLGFFLFREKNAARVIEGFHQFLGNRILDRVVVDVGVELVHLREMEMRIAEEFLQRRLAQMRSYTGLKKGAVVRLEGEGFDRRQLRGAHR